MSERLYGELAEWWPVLVPREAYGPECREILGLARAVRGRPAQSWLELGSATGALASHLPVGVEATLVDRSPEMYDLAPWNRRAEHIEADLRNLRLRSPSTWSCCTTRSCTCGAGPTCAAMGSVCVLAPDGVAVIIPDVVEETFEEGHVAGGGEAPDGRAARLLEWHWRPEPGGDTYVAEMSLLLRAPGERVVAVHESHTMGLFSRSGIRAAMDEAGLVGVKPPRRYRNAWPELFLGRRRR